MVPAKTTFLPLLLGAALLAPGVAHADPPGDWSTLRSDDFDHYACRERHRTDGPWWVRTVSEQTPKSRDAERHGIGIWSVLTRGGDRNEVTSRTTKNWRGGRIRTTLRRARSTDRLWVQGAYYGPTRPWRDGRQVGRLPRCA